MNVENFIITFLFGIATGVFCTCIFIVIKHKIKDKNSEVKKLCIKRCNLCKYYKERSLTHVSWFCKKEQVFLGGRGYCEDLYNTAKICESFEPNTQ